ncbi:MAG: succinyl-CoA synthetase subunit beta [Sulfitobacter sp.]
MFARTATALLTLTASLAAGTAVADAATVSKAFADHCFSPYLTVQTAAEALEPSGARVDFYDLRPFSSTAPSPVTGAPITAGTDRRCEVSFDGADTDTASFWLTKGLAREGLSDDAVPVPEKFPAQSGTVIIAAAQLNPKRIAVVQIGLREGPQGPETFLSIERLIPLEGEDE